MTIIKANTAEEMKAVIVQILEGWASNSRIAANNARLVSVRQEKQHMATAYEGAADFFNRCQIEELK